MKSLTKTIAFVTGLIVVLLACRSIFAGQDDELAVTDKYKNFEASKMFSIPTADVIGSKDIAIEAAKGSSDLFNARIGVGLGDVAEITTSVSQIKTDLKNKNAHMTSALKVRLLNNEGWVPATAVIISKGLPDSLRATVDGVKSTYGINTTDFYTMFKHGGDVLGRYMALNYGFRVSDTRIYNSTTSHMDAQAMQLLPVVGLKIQTNSVVTSMLEYEQVPYYCLEGKPEVVREDVIHGGVRFFITSWMAVNAGAKYRHNAKDTKGDESGLANTELLLKLNMNIPTSLLFKRIGNQVKD